MHKTVGANMELPLLTRSLPPGLPDVTLGAPPSRGRYAKASEAMGAGQCRCTSAQSPQFQWSSNGPDKLAAVRHPGSAQAIEVITVQSASPRVEAGIYFGQPMYRHAVRCERIEPFCEAGNVVAAVRENGVSHLPSGVNTGICAPGPANPNGPTIQCQQGLFKDALNSGKFWLDLPSGKL